MMPMIIMMVHRNSFCTILSSTERFHDCHSYCHINDWQFQIQENYKDNANVLSKYTFYYYGL